MWIELDKQYAARGQVGLFPVVAYGELAKTLGSLPSDTKLTATASLSMHTWTTKEGKGRSQMELVLTSISDIEKPAREVA